MDQALISVVIPVYNVENYVGKCIDSVLNQTYQNLEIVLVDDGSTDNSGSICDEYMKKYSNIKVVHKENGGLSDARNCGINICHGDYITFIDSDDSIKKNYVAYLYELMQQYDCEMSICDFEYINEKGKVLNRVTNTGMVELFDRKEAIVELLNSSKINTSASMKLYKIQLFEGIRYPKGLLYEDVATTYKLILRCNKVVRGDVPLYEYLLRNGSITKQRFGVRKMDMVTNIETMCDDILQIYPDLEELCNTRIFSQYVATYIQATNTGCDNSIKRHLLMKIHSLSQKRLPCMSRKLQLYMIASKYCMLLFRVLTRVEFFVQKVRQSGMG